MPLMRGLAMIRPTVTVRLHCDPTTIRFEHDGAPFTSEELAALLSGGSSKDFESQKTTGRFGTGFLVTHVLAESVRLRGLLQLDERVECFDLTLDRGGDEVAILANIQQSHEAIRAAEPVPNLNTVQSAVLEYACGEANVFSLGLQELRRALPYLYGTRRTLGKVELPAGDGEIEIWEPSEVEETSNDNEYMEFRTITVTSGHMPKRSLRVYRFLEEHDALAAVLVVVEQTSRDQTVCLPDADAPRVFREYPLFSSGFLPINFVFDGKFDVEQERRGLLMSVNDKALLKQAFSAGALAVKYAIEQKWQNAHWLARAARPGTGFDASNTDEKDWWTKQLKEFCATTR